MPKVRLDQLVVQRGLAPSRERARALILAGQVTVDDRPATKAGTVSTTIALGAPMRAASALTDFIARNCWRRGRRRGVGRVIQFTSRRCAPMYVRIKL